MTHFYDLEQLIKFWFWLAFAVWGGILIGMIFNSLIVTLIIFCTGVYQAIKPDK